MRNYIRQNPIIIMIISLFLSEIVICYHIGESKWGIIPNRLIMGIIMIVTMHIVVGKEIYIWSKKSGRYALLRSSYQLILCSLGLVLIFINSFRGLNVNSLAIIISNFSLSLLIGFFEEGLYRGIILNGLIKVMTKDKRGLNWAVAINGFIFGFIHVWGYVIKIGTNPLSIMVQMTVKIIITGSFGILLAVIYLNTKNIWSCMIIHALNDFLLFLPMKILRIEKIQYVDITKTMDLKTSVFTIVLALLVSMPNITISLRILKRLKPEECIFWK